MISTLLPSFARTPLRFVTILVLRTPPLLLLTAIMLIVIPPYSFLITIIIQQINLMSILNLVTSWELTENFYFKFYVPQLSTYLVLGNRGAVKNGRA